MKTENTGNVIIPSNTHPWAHELRVAKILASTGFVVEFLPTSSIKTADILLDGVEFEIKSPFTNKANTIDHMIRRAIRQSPNLIIDSSRMKNIREPQVKNLLINQARRAKQLKRLILVTKSGQIIDIMSLI